MQWVEALRSNSSLWDDFKETLANKRQRLLETLITCPLEGIERVRGQIEAIDGLVAEATAEEREENARSIRRERKPS
jgi:hypothetical protein